MGFMNSLGCSWDIKVISRRLKNQTMLDKKHEREEAEESDSA
jgi:hypothetical protein